MNINLFLIKSIFICIIINGVNVAYSYVHSVFYFITYVVDLDIDKKLELQREVLVNCRQYIVQYLSPDDIVDHLISKRLIGESARQELSLPNKTPQEKNRIIVDQLSTGGPDAFEKFCVILKKDRTKHIADKLEEGMYDLI